MTPHDISVTNRGECPHLVVSQCLLYFQQLIRSLINLQRPSGIRLWKSTWTDKITVFLRCVLFAQWHAHILKAGTKGLVHEFFMPLSEE